MKRILSVMMACALLLVGLTGIVLAEAAPSLDITVDSTAVNVGDIVTADIYMNDYVSKSWVAVTVTVNYDNTVLEYVDVVNGELLTAAGIEAVPVDKGDSVHINWLSMDGIPNDPAKPLATVRFKAVAESTGVTVGTKFVEDGQVAATDPENYIENLNGSAFVKEETVIETPIVVSPEGTVEPNKATIESVVAPDNAVEFDVEAEFSSAARVDRYKVDVEWTNPNFTYTEAATLWKPGEHKWEETSDATWAGEGVLTVKNHSSKAVTAKFAYAPNGNDTEMAFTISDVAVPAEGVSVNAPLETEENAATTDPGKVEVTCKIVAGTISNEEAAKIGGITVTIE